MSRFCALVLAAVTQQAAAATVALPFSDHLVLQRDQPDPIWGTGSVGESIVVTIAGQTQRTVVDKDGAGRSCSHRWRRADPIP
ncbi:MAG: hypothetical protein H0X38_02560 [Planctomycetes bacterium]|nr:hypothetical protein [Planctomycetota bacterium]